MPWKACSAMEERLRFVARLLDGEAMTDVCREFGISRKTGYKILTRYKDARYKDEGSAALTDRCRRPVRYANQLPPQIEGLIVSLKRGKPHWGARKIRELLVRRLPRSLVARPASCASPPKAPSTPCSIAMVWSAASAADATAPRVRPCQPATNQTTSGAPTSKASSASATAVTATRSPLTVTDHASRFLLLCEALDSVREEPAIAAFQRLFAERGLPSAIRSDNGVPFASPNALFNLSKMSVWWLRLGIAIERIKPGNPQQNGRHERMHLTLKKETTRPPGMNSLQQQVRFDHFVQEFNTERPHEALEMKRPADLYTSSSNPYFGLPDLDYPLHHREYLVTACGRICMHRKKINISTVLAGQKLGLKEVDDGIWLVSFYALRYRLHRPGAENPATHRQPVRLEVVTHVLGTGCYPCLRAGPLGDGGGSGIRTHGTLSRTHAFQACALSRSAIPPAQPKLPSQPRPTRQAVVRRPSSGRRGRRTAGSPPCRTGASASFPPSASRAACACELCRRRSTSPSRPSTARRSSRAR